MKIAAGILAYNEHPSMIEAARESCADLDAVFVFGEDVTIGNETEEAAARQQGLELAARMDADWYLQIDADERLRRGILLYHYLKRAESPWWPLPYVQEQGWTTVAPCKLIRLPARCVLASDVYDFGDGPTLLSGYTYPEELELILPRLPRLLHVPSERPDAIERRRLSVAIEGSDQAGRIGAHKPELPWIVPPAIGVNSARAAETTERKGER